MKYAQWKSQFSSDAHMRLHLLHYQTSIVSCPTCDEILHYDSKKGYYCGCEHNPGIEVEKGLTEEPGIDYWLTHMDIFS